MLIRVRPGPPEVREVTHEIDERRLMAYAAGVQDTTPPLFDLDLPGGIVAHPVFPVCLEWPLIVHGAPGLDYEGVEPHSGLHASHEITLHRAIRVGDRLKTTARLVTAEPRSIGAYVEVALETETTDGEPVASSREGILFRGVSLEGGSPRRAGEAAPGRGGDASLSAAGSFFVGVADAVVYTECAQIWNPIHTDPRAARAIGLPAPILHGTATLARAISVIVSQRLDGDPLRVSRLRCRFTGIVLPESTVDVSASDVLDDGGRPFLAFEAQTSPGGVALRDGLIELRPA